MTGFRLVKISKIHMIKCLIFQDERKLKDYIFLSFCLSYLYTTWHKNSDNRLKSKDYSNGEGLA